MEYNNQTAEYESQTSQDNAPSNNKYERNPNWGGNCPVCTNCR